jgi:cyclophilin family peptidyl-prolyl cis-trans isomerase
MAAINPGDVVKDNKGVLVPVLAILAIVGGMAYFYGQGGDFFGAGSEIGEGLGGGDDGTSTQRTEYDSEPDMQLEDGADYSAVISTNYGDITVDLFEDRAPRTVNNFVFLAEEGFYDGLTFHRVVEDFVIQGGDPSGDGTGGPGYSFDDEINPETLGLDEVLVEDAPFLEGLYSTWDAATAGYAPNSLKEHANDTLADFYEDVIGYDYTYSLNSYPFEPGVLAMANSGPGTNGSQFFITVTGSNTSSLTGRHTVFGKVTDGMNVVDKIAKVQVDSASMPVNTVEIKSITVVAD